MENRMVTVESDPVRVVVNPEGGHLDEVAFRTPAGVLRPMHRAPWRPDPSGAGGEALGDDIPVVLRSLAGDFFCAPFAENDVTGGPGHGPPANGLWRHEGTGPAPGGGLRAVFALEPRVLGASLTKEITLRPGHPVVYQRHVFSGGEGALPVAHHAMIRAPGGVALSFSPKAFGATGDVALETDPALGRSILAYPQRFADPHAVRLAAGGTVDITRYPFAEGHEDLVLLAEAPGTTPDGSTALGWSAALAAADGFLFFAVKDAALLPHTMLWMSNGGRDYAPWSGRHRAVLGIEEACTFIHAGHRASAAPNAFTAEGQRTALPLDPAGTLAIAYAFGAVPAPAGWSRVAGLDIGRDRLTIRGDGGQALEVPFDAGHFDEAEGSGSGAPG